MINLFLCFNLFIFGPIVPKDYPPEIPKGPNGPMEPRTIFYKKIY